MAAIVPDDILLLAVVDTPILSFVGAALVAGFVVGTIVGIVVGKVVAFVVGAVVGITAMKDFPASRENWQPLLSNAATRAWYRIPSVKLE